MSAQVCAMQAIIKWTLNCITRTCNVFQEREWAPPFHPGGVSIGLKAEAERVLQTCSLCMKVLFKRRLGSGQTWIYRQPPWPLQTLLILNANLLVMYQRSSYASFAQNPSQNPILLSAVANTIANHVWRIGSSETQLAHIAEKRTPSIFSTKIVYGK